MRTFLIAASLLAAAPVGATTLVDTGPAGGGPSWTLASAQWLGGEFTLGAAAVVTSVEGYSNSNGFGGGFGNGGTLTAAIYASDGVSSTPGAELFSTQFTGLDSSSFGWMGPSGLSWALPAGTYWVTFEVRAGDTYFGVLGGTSPNPLARELFSVNDVWQQPFGLRNGWRITGGVIPEPATWAMMIAGFGLVGAAARRRRAEARGAAVPVAA